MEGLIPEISIIVPVYNTENYLKECLESLVNQNLKNFEIIIVNDGSTDNSELIIQEFAKKYPFVSSIAHKNKGLGATRNVGATLAQGEYVYFMDSDDYLVPGGLDRIIKMAQKNNLEALFFDAESFVDNQNSTLLNTVEFDYSRKKSYGLYLDGEGLLLDLLRDNSFYSSACLYVIKRSVYLEKQLSFIEGYLHEDEIFTIELFLAIEKCMHINEPIFQRRIRGNSIMTSSKLNERIKGYLEVLKGMEILYRDHIFKNPETKKFFKKRMGNFYVRIADWSKKSDLKKNDADYFSEANKIGKKYYYFNIRGILIRYFYPVYEFMKKIR